MKKVPYNNTRGGANAYIAAPTPYDLQQVKAQVFPLRASLYRLERFCDRYLNSLVPEEVGYFAPPVPYAFLVTVNYGRAAIDIVNLGWLAQNELMFVVPVNWYRRVGRRWTFEGQALLTPFIFVEDPWALTLGRDVYGWPKSIGLFEPELDPWRLQSDSNKPLVMRGMVLPELYQGLRQEPRTLVEVERLPLPRVFMAPPSVGEILDSLPSLARYMAGGDLFLKSFLEVAAAAFFRGKEPGQLQLLAAHLLGMGQVPFLPPFRTKLHNINLKQFPSVEDPERISYQSVNTSQMEIMGVNGIGLLGGQRTLGGDVTGGYSIKLHDYEAQPFVEALGLRVSHWKVARGSGPRSSNAIACLHPVLPFWLDLDMRYGTGHDLCWRTKRSSWYIRERHGETEKSGDPLPPEHPGHRYNTTLGDSTRVIPGPFDFDLTVRVLPLLADKQTLERFCESYLENDFYVFEAWGSYVYLLVTSYESISSDSNSVGVWADHDVKFSIPLRWYEKKSDGKGRLLSSAMVSPFCFTDSELAAITARELDGLPMEQAWIGSGIDGWLAASGPSDGTDRQLMLLESSVLPALNAGQRVDRRHLLEVVQGDVLPYNDDVGWRQVANDWGRQASDDALEKELLRQSSGRHLEVLKTLALELLTRRFPLNSVALKQFRDVEDTQKAAYQSLVLSELWIQSIQDIRSIEEKVHVLIHRYPTQPLVDTLGLKVKHSRVTRNTFERNGAGGGTVDCLQPIRPFWVRVKARREIGTGIGFRAGSEKWENENRPPDFFVQPEHRKVEINPGVLEHIDGRAPQNLGRIYRDWLSQEGRSPGLSLEEVESAVNGSVTPQMAIESILSSEWEHWGRPRWWDAQERHREAEKKSKKEGGMEFDFEKWNREGRLPDFCVRRDTIPMRRFDELWLGEDHPDRWKNYDSRWLSPQPEEAEDDEG